MPFREELQTVPFDDIESKSDFQFLDVYERGPFEDDRYLTKDRFLNIKQDELTLVDVRFFLWCYMGLSSLFDGAGYTMDASGNRGCKEYLMKNMKVSDIDNLKVVKLNVNIPNQ